MKRVFQSIGPAVIVAAVVLGPGSILTSSKVGATFGLLGLPVVIGAAVLMIAMVALAARLGVVYEQSLCDELAARLGRVVAVFIGVVLFTLVALFQSSNNIALVGGIEPMLGDDSLPTSVRISILLVFNGLIVVLLYWMRNLYGFVEKLMKFLIAFMCLAFLVNFLLVLFNPPDFEPVIKDGPVDLIPLLGMIGTTFSVGGAFYQAYLVKEKGWGLADAKKGMLDSIVSISMLGAITAVLLLTAWRTFYGLPEGVVLASVGDVARQLEPLFGSGAKVIFAGGILAGALSSFLVNAMIGGTVFADSLGKGSRMQDRWTVHMTALALIIGMGVAIAAFTRQGSTVLLITIAQACTVVGIPALAAALIYLGTRKELTGEKKVPRWILIVAAIGFIVSLILAGLTANTVIQKFS